MRAPWLTLLAVLAVVIGACSIDAAELPATPIPTDVPTEVALATAIATPTEAAATESPAPAGPAYRKLRVFVASENTEQVWVLEGAPKEKFALVAKIPVGKLPHQMAVSPDGKYVAVNNRLGDSTSIIDPVAMKELVRIKVGKQPHGIAFSPDSKTLFVAHEKDTFIMRFEVGSWRLLAPIIVGVPQHVLTIGSKRPNLLLFTVTNSNEPDHLPAYHLEKNTIT